MAQILESFWHSLSWLALLPTEPLPVFLCCLLSSLQITVHFLSFTNGFASITLYPLLMLLGHHLFLLPEHLSGVLQKRMDLSILSTVFTHTHTCPSLNFSLSVEWLGKVFHLSWLQALYAGLGSSIASCLHKVSSFNPRVPGGSNSPIPHLSFFCRCGEEEVAALFQTPLSLMCLFSTSLNLPLPLPVSVALHKSYSYSNYLCITGATSKLQEKSNWKIFRKMIRMFKRKSNNWKEIFLKRKPGGT